MASLVYKTFKKEGFGGSIDVVADTIKILLVMASYTPDVAHDFLDDITNEVSGTGYTTGGAALGSKSNTNVGTKAVFTSDPVTWSTATVTARGAVIYKSTGVAGTSQLICYIDFGSDKTSSGGDFKITPDATNGWVYLD